MKLERVFVVSSGFTVDSNGGHLFIIDRSKGTLLNKIEHLHLHGIVGVRVFNNRDHTKIRMISCRRILTQPGASSRILMQTDPT